MAIRSLRRPVVLASYRPLKVVEKSVPEGEEPDQEPGVDLPVATIRRNFPVRGEETEGGQSDGYCFRISFCAGRLDRSYELLRSFLREQGYGDVPVPAELEELRQFRIPPKLRHQLSLFGEDGYIHNPVKILFPPPGRKRGTLILELYNESSESHLLRFHRRK